jgi:hypothetical protein
VQKWEYCLVSAMAIPEKEDYRANIVNTSGRNEDLEGDDVSIVDICGRMGKDGWELVSFSERLYQGGTTTRLVFKRPLDE